MALTAEDYLHCPQCGKKGVTLHRDSEDYYGCRYCPWTVSSHGEDETDRIGRRALAVANPSRDIWVTDIPSPDPNRPEPEQEPE